jgi:hypothetical protein
MSNVGYVSLMEPTVLISFRCPFQYWNHDTWLDGGVSPFQHLRHCCLSCKSGFGQVMKGATITVMWHNSDGSFTVSQRDGGPGEQEPTLVPSPSRVAVVDNSISVVSVQYLRQVCIVE